MCPGTKLVGEIFFLFRKRKAMEKRGGEGVRGQGDEGMRKGPRLKPCIFP